jgi:hypothetical protein
MQGVQQSVAGLGRSLGALAGGFAVERLGVRRTFFWFAIGVPPIAIGALVAERAILCWRVRVSGNMRRTATSTECDTQGPPQIPQTQTDSIMPMQT